MEVPSNVLAQLEDLKKEVAQLKQQLAQSGSGLPASKPTVTRPTKSSKGYRADRNKVNAILQEAVENPELKMDQLDPSSERLGKLSRAWQVRIRPS